MIWALYKSLRVFVHRHIFLSDLRGRRRMGRSRFTRNRGKLDYLRSRAGSRAGRYQVFASIFLGVELLLHFVTGSGPPHDPTTTAPHADPIGAVMKIP
jgi:hypothetical protein